MINNLNLLLNRVKVKENFKFIITLLLSSSKSTLKMSKTREIHAIYKNSKFFKLAQISRVFFKEILALDWVWCENIS